MTPSEVYNISHNSNYFYIHFYDENVLERLWKSKMNTVCMKDGSCPEIKLFIPAGNYNSPKHSECNRRKMWSYSTSNPQYDLIKL